MPVRSLIGSAVSLSRRAVVAGLDAASRLRGRDDTRIDAPKPGEPGGPRSGTAPVRAKPKKPAAAKAGAKPAAKRAAKRATARRTAAKREPAATANGAGAQDKPGAVPTGRVVRSKTPSR